MEANCLTACPTAARDLSRRAMVGRLAGTGAVAALLVALASSRRAVAQVSTPEAGPAMEEPFSSEPLLSAVFTDLPAVPAQVLITRTTTQPGAGDLDDIIVFPGPVAFIVEEGVLTCRCGTEEDPCMIIGVTGAGEPAPPWPAEFDLNVGEGLYIPFNVPDSAINRGDVPNVTLDLLIAPAEEMATPTA